MAGKRGRKMEETVGANPEVLAATADFEQVAITEGDDLDDKPSADSSHPADSGKAAGSQGSELHGVTGRAAGNQGSDSQAATGGEAGTLGSESHVAAEGGSDNAPSNQRRSSIFEAEHVYPTVFGGRSRDDRISTGDEGAGEGAGIGNSAGLGLTGGTGHGGTPKTRAGRKGASGDGTCGEGSTSGAGYGAEERDDEVPEGGSSGASGAPDMLEALDRALLQSFKGDVRVLQGRMHCAAAEYSRGILDLSCSNREGAQCVHPKLGRRLAEAQTLPLLTRAYSYWCLAERATVGGEFDLARQFFRRILRDSRIFMGASERWGYVMGAHALAKLGNSPKVSVALLVRGLRCKDNTEVRDLLAAYVRKGQNEGDEGMLQQVLQDQEQWEAGAEEDATWLEEMRGKPDIMEVLSRVSTAETSGALLLKDKEQLQANYAPSFPSQNCRFFLYDDDSLEGLNDEPARSHVSALRECVLEEMPGGLYSELSCTDTCCNRRKDSGKSASDEIWGLELARQCNRIGNREAESGRLVPAAHWYTTGLTLLLPEKWEHFKQELHIPGTLPVALALLHNRSLVFRQFGETLHFAEDGRSELFAIRDSLWCAYYGHGWAAGTIQLGKDMLVRQPCAVMGLYLVEAEIEKFEGRDGRRRKQRSAPEELVSACDGMTDTLERCAREWGPTPDALLSMAPSMFASLLGEVKELLPTETQWLMEHEIAVFATWSIVEMAKSFVGVRD